MKALIALVGALVVTGVLIGMPAVLGGMIGAATASYGWAAFSSISIYVLMSLAIQGLKS